MGLHLWRSVPYLKSPNLLSEEGARIYSPESDEGPDEDGAQRSLTAKKLTTDEVKPSLFNPKWFPCSHKPTPRIRSSQPRSTDRCLHISLQLSEMHAVTSLGVAQRNACHLCAVGGSPEQSPSRWVLKEVLGWVCQWTERPVRKAMWLRHQGPTRELEVQWNRSRGLSPSPWA